MITNGLLSISCYLEMIGWVVGVGIFGEMTHQLSTLLVLSELVGLMSCSVSSRGPSALFWPLSAPPHKHIKIK